MQYQTYISHHGIDGQKWGVRNGPPYPLKRYRKGMSEKIGERNAKKRLKRINFLESSHITKILNTFKLEELKKASNEILNDPDKQKKYGHAIMGQKAGTSAVWTSSMIGMSYLIGSGVLDTKAVAPTNVAVSLGLSFINNAINDAMILKIGKSK